MTDTGRDQRVERLLRRQDFLAARQGERRRGPFFLLEVRDRGLPADPPRVGFTVTRKQGNAVERNRMRRRLKEAVRLVGQFAMRPGHDYVLVARREALSAPFSRLTSAVKDRIEGRGKVGTGGPERRRGEGPAVGERPKRQRHRDAAGADKVKPTHGRQPPAGDHRE